MGFAENAHFIRAVPIFTTDKEDANQFKPWLPVLQLASHSSLDKCARLYTTMKNSRFSANIFVKTEVHLNHSFTDIFI